MKKLLALFPFPFLVLACGADQQHPAVPSGEQVIALVTTAGQQSSTLAEQAMEFAEVAKTFEAGFNYEKGLAAAKKVAAGAVVVADFGLALCVSLPQEAPYLEPCAKLADAKVFAEQAVSALSLLGAQ